MDKPFFVVGASRSGTTLMRLILNAHPQLAMPGETRFFMGVWEPFHDAAVWPEAVDTFLEICRQRLEPPIDLEDLRAELLALPAPDFRALIDLPLSRWAAHDGKRRWGEKTPDHIFYSEPILRLFPDARFIEMIRDPRAVVASMTRSELKGSDPTRNALYWKYALTTGHETLHRNARAQVMSVHYEDLVTEPERVVREVCGFLDESFEPEMLAFHERSSTYLRTTRVAGDPKLMLPVSADLDGWRSQLAPRDVAITEKICATTMRRLGYEPSGRAVTPAERGRIAANEAYVALKHLQQRDRYFHGFTGPVAGRVVGSLRRAARGRG